MSFAESLIKSPLRGKWDSSSLVVGKERVDDFGEVFTPDNIVSDMLDLISEKYSHPNNSLPISRTFLEPSCGTGNFLVQILERKLVNCETEEEAFKAVSTIYGVDIQKDNVLESRLRMLEIIESKFPNKEFLTIIADVLEKNIIGGDMIEDKRGCMLSGNWVKGTVKNSTGTVEDDGIGHTRLIAYNWEWGTPVKKIAEYLVEDIVDKPNESVEPVKVESTSDLMARFKNLF